MLSSPADFANLAKIGTVLWKGSILQWFRLLAVYEQQD